MFEPPSIDAVATDGVWSEVAAAAATLVAAFLGAWFAFLLQAREKKHDERSRHIAAANRAIFAVFQQVNRLRLFQHDMIDPYRKRPSITLSMPAVPPEAESVSHLDFQGLEFLFSTKHREVVFDLFLEDQRFRATLTAINYRSQLHLERVQPALMQAGLHGQATLEQIIAALGVPLFDELKSATEQVVFHVDRTVGSLDALRQKLRAAFLELYPEGTFIDFELLTGDEIGRSASPALR